MRAQAIESGIAGVGGRRRERVVMDPRQTAARTRLACAGAREAGN
jgi:hypothetical protein